MQTLQIPLERRLAEEFERVRPSKQTDLSRKKDSGYYNLKALDTVINQTFERFAYDKGFQRIVGRKPVVMEAMKRIKKMYHDEIISYDFPINTFENLHTREFRAILDTRLNAEDFYKRLQELEMYLVTVEKTMISDELKYAFLAEEKKRMREEKLQVYKLLKEEARKKYQEARQSTSFVRQAPRSMEALKTSLYQNNIDYIKATPSLALCVKNHDSCELIPSLKLLVGADENTDRKILEIFSNNKSLAYRNFISRVKETMSTKNAVLENILKREAAKSGKQSPNFQIIDLNSATWNWLSSYYNSNTQVKNFVIKYKEDYAKSLTDLIDETYLKILRSPETLN